MQLNGTLAGSCHYNSHLLLWLIFPAKTVRLPMIDVWHAWGIKFANQLSLIDGLFDFSSGDQLQWAKKCWIFINVLIRRLCVANVCSVYLADSISVEISFGLNLWMDLKWKEQSSLNHLPLRGGPYSVLVGSRGSQMDFSWEKSSLGERRRRKQVKRRRKLQWLVKQKLLMRIRWRSLFKTEKSVMERQMLSAMLRRGDLQFFCVGQRVMKISERKRENTKKERMYTRMSVIRYNAVWLYQHEFHGWNHLSDRLTLWSWPGYELSFAEQLDLHHRDCKIAINLLATGNNPS